MLPSACTERLADDATGAPLGWSGVAEKPPTDSTWRTCGSRPIVWISAVLSPELFPSAGLNSDDPMSRSEGFVLRTKAENEDCVRRAAASVPIASPPRAPTRSTMTT